MTKEIQQAKEEWEEMYEKACNTFEIVCDEFGKFYEKDDPACSSCKSGISEICAELTKLFEAFNSEESFDEQLSTISFKDVIQQPEESQEELAETQSSDEEAQEQTDAEPDKPAVTEKKKRGRKPKQTKAKEDPKEPEEKKDNNESAETGVVAALGSVDLTVFEKIVNDNTDRICQSIDANAAKLGKLLVSLGDTADVSLKAIGSIDSGLINVSNDLLEILKELLLAMQQSSLKKTLQDGSTTKASPLKSTESATNTSGRKTSASKKPSAKKTSSKAPVDDSPAKADESAAKSSKKTPIKTSGEPESTDAVKRRFRRSSN